MTRESDKCLASKGFSNLQLRYEQLRQQRLDGIFTPAMNLFVKKGMCDWIHARTDPVKAFDCKNELQTPLKEASWHKEHLSDCSSDSRELVVLIASMALTKIKRSLDCERKSV